MPRNLPQLDVHFKKECLKAVGLTENFERAFSMPQTSIKKQEVEYAYEIAYMRIFVGWEIFLEELLYRLFCGYITSTGRPTLNTGQTYCQNISAAKQLLHNGRDYLLWHDPRKVILRAERKLYRSNFVTVLSSRETRLVHFGNVRHRIAHAQDDAKNKFNLATSSLCGRRFPASRPGRFLRYRDTSDQTNPTYLDVLATELVSLSQQLCN